MTNTSESTSKLTILGYARKKDLNHLLDECAPNGSHINIGLDHRSIWREDEPYDHLTPVFVINDVQLKNWYEHHKEEYKNRYNVEPQKNGKELIQKAKEMIEKFTHEEYEAMRLFFSENK